MTLCQVAGWGWPGDHERLTTRVASIEPELDRHGA